LPRVTIALAVYDPPEHLLREAIESVLGQTYDDWELVIADDGSTAPHVHALLDGLSHPKVRVLKCETTDADREQHCRWAFLLNLIANTRSTGDLLCFLGHDDSYALDRLDRMVTTLDSNQCSVVYGTQELRDELGTPFSIRAANVTLTDAFERVDLNSVMVTRKAFQQVGGFPEEPHAWRNADAYLWRKLTDAGHLFYPVPGPPTDHKHFRSRCVTDNVLKNLPPWHNSEAPPMIGHPHWVP
jgi:hypothetical protein